MAADITYKEITICEGERVINMDFSPYTNSWYVLEVETPDFVTAFSDPFSGGVYGYVINADEASAGDYLIRFSVFETSNRGPAIGKFQIKIHVGECVTPQVTCCKPGTVYIRWLSRTGGINEWPFPGVREYELRMDDGKMFKNYDLILQDSEIPNVYYGKNITSGDITKEQYDFVSELRYAIQAWEWNSETQTATPIRLDRGSFSAYKSNSKFYEIAARYVLAREIIVQTQ